MMTGRYQAHVDGAAFGNPGPAGIGVVLDNCDGQKCLSIPIGTATNNQAEYAALITALEQALERGAGEIEVFSDSELIVRQINGQYRVKNEALKPLYSRAKQLQRRFTVFSITYIPRELNSQADRLAKLASRRQTR